MQMRQVRDTGTGGVLARDSFTECGWQKSMEGNAGT